MADPKPVDNPAEKLITAQAYIERLEQALLVFGLNPQNETIDIRDCARAYARGRADEQAMLDAAQAKVKSLTTELAAERKQTEVTKQWGEAYERALRSYFTKMGLDGSLDEMMAQVDKICEESNALRLIAELVGLSRFDPDPDTIRRRVKDIRTERDTARASVKDLEKTLEASRSATQTYASAEIRANEHAAKAKARVKELEDDLLKLRAAKCLDAMDANAGIVVEPADPTRDYNAEVIAARIDALKTLGVNPYDPPVCIIGAAKKRAKTLEHAQQFEDELAQIWELWGSGRPMTPGCVYEAAQAHERANTALHAKLGAIAEKLDGANLPTHYGRTQQGGPIPLPERVDLLIASHDCARLLAESWETMANLEISERMDANALLDDLGAPSHAGPIALNLSARIYALPGLLRPE